VTSFPYAAAHASEIQYVFDLPITVPAPGLGADQQKLAATMISYWTTFARTGQPNSRGVPAFPAYQAATDTAQSLKAWSLAQGYTFPLLSDFWPHGEVAKAYGVFFDKAGMALRGTFLVDVDGVIRFAEANGPGEARDQAAWKRAVAALPAHSS